MKNKTVIAAKAAVWAVGLAPALRLVYRGVWTTLGANPVEFITLSTGTWSLVFLMATLAITPLRRWAGLNWLIRIRRLAGLFSFFYGCIHFITYVWLDKFFDLRDMAKDIVRRPFITMGFIALSLMIPLAATSSTAAIRRLGGKWQSLHRLVYVSAAAAVVHFWWKVKADIREPAIYAGILATLLITRLWSRKAANIKKTCQKWAKLS